jgi:hypothetical protein
VNILALIMNVEAVLANELVEVSPINVAEPVTEEPLQVITGPIPIASILGQPLGFNIQDILKDIEFESEDSVGMGGDNMGRSVAEGVVVKTPTKSLSPIPEAGATSHVDTSKRPRSLTPVRVNKASGSKRPRASKASYLEAFDSKGYVEIKPSRATWSVGGNWPGLEVI